MSIIRTHPFLHWIAIALLSAECALAAAADDSIGQTRNLIFVTTDGLRWQEVFEGADPGLINKEHGKVENVAALRDAFWRESGDERRRALMPFLWSVVAGGGQLFGNTNRGSVVRVSNGLNFSYPGYQELLCGFPDARIDSNEKRPNPNVTVLEWLNRKPSFQNRVAAFCGWDVFAYIINRDRSGVLVHAGPEPLPGKILTPREELLNQLILETPVNWEGALYDSFVFHAAFAHLERAGPRVLYIAFDETDEWAHYGRYDRYLEAAHRVDQYISRLWEAVQSLPDYKDQTTLVITTDHGRGSGPVEWKNHGKNTAGAEHIWIAILGPDTPAMGERSDTPGLTQSQLAATLARFLGEDYVKAMPQAAEPIPGLYGGKRTGPKKR